MDLTADKGDAGLRRRMESLLAAGRTTRFAGVVFRLAHPKFAGPEEVATGEGARLHGARWNAPLSFAAVYASATARDCVEEALAWCARYNLPQSAGTPAVLVALECHLVTVLDLTDAATRRRIGLSRAAIVDDRWWLEQSEGRESSCQAVGRAAFAAGVEAIKVPSVRVARAWNLVIFPRNLHPGSFIKMIRRA